MRRNGENYYYHVNGLGTVTALTDSSRTIAQSYVYDSFGKIISHSGNVENPYTYTAREHDAETGLYYYRARYYDAGIGRFISEDPIGIDGGINLYLYVQNNPVNYVDPFGLDRYSWCEIVPGPLCYMLTDFCCGFSYQTSLLCCKIELDDCFESTPPDDWGECRIKFEECKNKI
jgi:RHS repeat-associated protein